jgi:pilus assembly protein Flp/PilA
MFNAQMTRFGVALHRKSATLVTDDKGATAVEYGLIVGLIAVTLVLALTAVSGALNGLFDTIADTLGGAAA